jgi:NACalpha-BTF3-like transcription factor
MMIKHLQYLKYIMRHKWYVFIGCCNAGIWWRGLLHDLSKFSPSEWGPYAEYFYGGEHKTFDELMLASLDTYECWEMSKEGVEEAFDRAWLHHQHHSPHHWQYYVLREDSGATKVLEIPKAFRKELLADWKGAGRAIVGKAADTKAWYLENRANMLLAPQTQRWIEDQLGLTDAERFDYVAPPLVISKDDVMFLRTTTGCTMARAKRALQNSGGDVEKACAALQHRIDSTSEC